MRSRRGCAPASSTSWPRSSAPASAADLDAPLRRPAYLKDVRTDAETHGVERDRGSIVLGWLIKVAAAIMIVGLAGFDGVSAAVAHLNGTHDANSAAYAASQAYQPTHDLR